MFIQLNPKEKEALKMLLHQELRGALKFEHGELLHNIYKRITGDEDHPVWSSRREEILKRTADTC